MSGLAILLPIALGLGLMGLAAFFWAARSGQFEDLDGASMRVLIDEEGDRPPPWNDEWPRREFDRGQRDPARSVREAANVVLLS